MFLFVRALFLYGGRKGVHSIARNSTLPRQSRAVEG